MALTQVFQFSQSQDASLVYVTDITGDYNASTNPGGYGAPNTARNALANYIILEYKASTGDESLTVEAYDPEDVEQWTATWNENDGHFTATVYPVPIKTGAETPAENDFVHDAAANQLQRWNGAAWVSAVVTELEDNDFSHTTTNYPILANMYVAFNNLNKLLISGCKTAPKSDIQKYIIDTQGMIYGTIALFAEGSYQQAQENIEKFNSKVVEFTALT